MKKFKKEVGMRKSAVLFVFLLAVCISIPAFAGEKANVDVGVEAYNVSGDTTYKISGIDSGYTWASELEFPIDTWFTKLSVHANVLKRVDLTLDYAWSIDDEAGTFKDTDWDDMVSRDPWVRSTGDAEIDAKEWNFDFKFLLTEMEVQNSIIDKVKLHIGAGYKQQTFDYSIDDVVQSSVFFPSYNGTAVGRGLDYSVEYSITYVSLYADFLNSFDKMDLLLGVEYGPRIDAEDRDDHILRYKLNESTGDGTYSKFAAQLSWNVWKNLSASAYFNYILIDVDGDQDQRYYDGALNGLTYNNVNWESDSEQTIYGLKFTWLFE